MNSKQRILKAIRCEQTDYIPCAPRFWSGRFSNPALKCDTEEERLEIVVKQLGLDGYVEIQLDGIVDDSCEERVWTSDSDSVLNKEIRTPTGVLSASIRLTDDLPDCDRKNIRLTSDWNASRFVKPWIETGDDVEKFGWVWQFPSDGDAMAEFKTRTKELRSLSETFGVPICGRAGSGLTRLLVMMGAQNAVYASVDNPEMVHRFLDIEHEVNLKAIDALINEGADIIVRNGFYETTDFWSPQQYRRFLFERIKEEADLTHAKGALFVYIMCTGIEPLLGTIRDLPIDAIWEVEPVLTGQSLKNIASQLRGKTCIWGGISAPEHIGRGTPQKVKAAVRQAVEDVGRTGLILAAVPSIRPYWSWDNVLAMIDEWRRVR